jgi:hypothetical protein
MTEISSTERLITTSTYDVRILANGQDVTERSPLATVKYDIDGSGSRTLKDGQVLRGTWRFIDSAQRQVEVRGPEGLSRWVIVELSEKCYRKVNIETGLEFVHHPHP